MRKLLLILCVVLVASCSKDKGTLESDTLGSISYKLNSTYFSYSNGNALKMNGTPGAIKTLYSLQGSSNNNSITLLIITDSLMKQQYHLTYGSLPTFTSGQKGYTVLDESSYFIDVKVTDYVDGVVSGTFSGKVTYIVSVNPQVVEDAAITDGKFNLIVKY